MTTRHRNPLLVLSLVSASLTVAQEPVAQPGSRIDLPSSKQIVGPVPGGPQRLSSMPVTLAVSPDGRWIVTVNGGFGSKESDYRQGLAVLDATTGRLVDYPDKRTNFQSKQVLFSGLAFSADSRHVYASLASETDPEGKQADDTGSAIAVYGLSEQGVLTPETLLKVPRQRLAPGHTTLLGKEPTLSIPYPAAIARLPGSGELLVAGNLSDDVLRMDPATGAVKTRFDLAESATVPGTYPIALAVAPGGQRAFVALWNASEVVELDLAHNTVARRLPLLKPAVATSAGSHPVALELTPDGRTLYVALSNRDAVAAVDLDHDRFALRGFFDTRLPGQSFYGAQPEALALGEDGLLYAADMGANAVAVLDPKQLTRRSVRQGMVEPVSYIPTEWLPMAVATHAGKLYIATGKGLGTGPNNFPQAQPQDPSIRTSSKRDFTYIATLLHGSLAAVDLRAAAGDRKALTEAVLVDNRMRAAEEKLAWSPAVLARTGPAGPIRHVIYIIRENRTYDQELGDLSLNGKPLGNGDASLAMYGESITPNAHRMAAQFGVLDNFYDSAEVSGDGHVWSNSAIGTDYLERTWQLDYRGGQRGYDYEGVVSQGLPLEQRIPDVNEPQTGYLWGNLARHGKTLYHFGEYIESVFCNEREGGGAQLDPTQGPMGPGRACASGNVVKPGERLPVIWGGEINRYPWAIPLLAENKATKPELVDHFAREYPDFNLSVPDQVRTDIFLRHLDGWLKDRAAGKDTMPNFVMLRLANDHTAGTTPGAPSPRSSIADNDLAVGRAVEAISHSPYWDDTAFFILEDDAQNGADHVDAHRSVAYVVSRYAPRAGAAGGSPSSPLVDSRFYSTVSMVRTMEAVLGLPPMNNNDALSSLMSPEFSGAGDQPPFVADTRNRDNGLLYEANAPAAPGAKESARMDFRHADRADAQKLNVILWQDAMGAKPVPALLTQKRRKAKKDDDD